VGFRDDNERNLTTELFPAERFRPAQKKASEAMPKRYSIVHPQKDAPAGRAIDTVKKIKLEVK